MEKHDKTSLFLGKFVTKLSKVWKLVFKKLDVLLYIST